MQAVVYETLTESTENWNGIGSFWPQWEIQSKTSSQETKSRQILVSFEPKGAMVEGASIFQMPVQLHGCSQTRLIVHQGLRYFASFLKRVLTSKKLEKLALRCSTPVLAEDRYQLMWELLQFTLDNICVLGCHQQLGSANQKMRPAQTRELIAVKVASQKSFLLFGMTLNLSEVCVAWDVPQSF
jgi:hypothetical protein